MSEYKDFSSLPPEQERSFSVFERATVENGKKAKLFSYIVSSIFLVVVLVIVFSFEPPPPLMSDEDLGGLKPAAAVKKEAEPKAEAPAQAEAEGEEAAAADADEANEGE